MSEMVTGALQLLAAAFVACGGVLCNVHRSVSDGVPADAERESAFTFSNANDYETGFRRLASRYSIVKEKRAAAGPEVPLGATPAGNL